MTGRCTKSRVFDILTLVHSFLVAKLLKTNCLVRHSNPSMRMNVYVRAPLAKSHDSRENSDQLKCHLFCLATPPVHTARQKQSELSANTTATFSHNDLEPRSNSDIQSHFTHHKSLVYKHSLSNMRTP